MGANERVLRAHQQEGRDDDELYGCQDRPHGKDRREERCENEEWQAACMQSNAVTGALPAAGLGKTVHTSILLRWFEAVEIVWVEEMNATAASCLHAELGLRVIVGRDTCHTAIQAKSTNCRCISAYGAWALADLPQMMAPQPWRANLGLQRRSQLQQHGVDSCAAVRPEGHVDETRAYVGKQANVGGRVCAVACAPGSWHMEH